VAPLSFVLKAKMAPVEVVGLDGPESIVVAGAVVSTTTVCADEAGDVLPPVSVAFAVYECEPSATAVSGLLQLPSAATVVEPFETTPSKTVTEAPGSAVPEIVTFAEFVRVPSGGLRITGAAGGVTSMVQLLLAGVGSKFPVLSMARTSNVWLPSLRPV
jgi:hypothetical protein